MEDIDWICLAQARDRWCANVEAVMNLRIPQNATNFLTSRGTFVSSRRTLSHGFGWVVHWLVGQIVIITW